MIELIDSLWAAEDQADDLPTEFKVGIVEGQRVVVVFGDLACPNQWPSPTRFTMRFLELVYREFGSPLRIATPGRGSKDSESVSPLVPASYFAQIFGMSVDHVLEFTGLSMTERDASMFVFIGTDTKLDRLIALVWEAVHDAGEALVTYPER